MIAAPNMIASPIVGEDFVIRDSKPIQLRENMASQPVEAFGLAQPADRQFEILAMPRVFLPPSSRCNGPTQSTRSARRVNGPRPERRGERFYVERFHGSHEAFAKALEQRHVGDVVFL